jgi:DNA primase
VLDKHNLDTTEGQLAALDEAARIVARIKDTGMRVRYAVNLDRWLGLMDERFVLARVRRAAPGNRATRVGPRRSDERSAAANGDGQRRADGQPAATERPYDRSDPVLRVEREALKLAVQWPALCGPEFDALGAAAFTVPAHGAVQALIAGCGGVASAGRARDWVTALLEAAPDDGVRSLVTELAVETLQVAGRVPEPDEKYADVVLARVGELATGRQISGVKARLQRTNPVEEQAAYNRMFGELVALEQRRKWLLDRATGG